MYPLGLDGISSFAGFDPAMLHESHESPDINIPFSTDGPVGALAIDVDAGEGFTGGAPLNRFDSLESFRAWAGSHCILRKIEFIETIPYTGNVYNLTVDNDESYVIPLAIVHNCRCTVVSISASEMKRDNLTEDRGTPVFRKNPPEGEPHIVRQAPPDIFDKGFGRSPGDPLA
jgi:hypothetical protein